MNKMKITSHSYCNCGAVTVYFDNGEENSVLKRNMKRHGINLIGSKKMNDTYCCNHCVNHYGIDLCQCGSGELIGKCECGSVEPRETLGRSVKLFQEIKLLACSKSK